MLRDLHDNTRSKRSTATRRLGAVSPESVCSQSSRFMPTSSRFSPCRQMMSEVCTRASCTCAEITARSSASSAINLSWAVTACTYHLRVLYRRSVHPICANLMQSKTANHPRNMSKDMLLRNSRSRSIADALDGSAARRQFFLEPFKPAVEMVDAVDHGLAFGREPRDHQRHRGAQIRRHDGRAAQLVDALDGGGLAIEMNLRAEPRQFLHVHEAIFEDRLGDARRALSAGHQRHQLGLQVGRKARKRCGRNRHRHDPGAVAGNSNTFIVDGD